METTEQKSSNRIQRQYNLRCEACGNEDLFVQIAHFEAHLINRHLDYKQLLFSDIDHYECYFCQSQVDEKKGFAQV